MSAYNKFLVALIMAAIEFARVQYGIDLGLDEPTVTILVGFITAFLVWLVPNRPKEGGEK